jgi:hypothetical protein
MTIQEKAAKLLKVLDPTDYRYQIAETVSRTKSDFLRHNSCQIVERAYKIRFGRDNESAGDDD